LDQFALKETEISR